MLAMTSPRTGSKVLLLASPRAATGGSTSPPIRRFRIARLRLDGKRASDSRFAPVKGS
jgi:hypothetical protein